MTFLLQYFKMIAYEYNSLKMFAKICIILKNGLGEKSTTLFFFTTCLLLTPLVLQVCLRSCLSVFNLLFFSAFGILCHHA